MKIFIDIGHPAHVHYFRNFILAMKEKGHTIFITARDKEVTFRLLDYYQLSYVSRGKGKKGVWGKFLYIFQADLFLLRKAIRFKPDVFLSFGSPYAAHTAWLMRKPHIAFDDTDRNFFEHLLYVPFTHAILTPWVYTRDYGSKQYRFKGFMELCALYPGRFRAGPAEILLAQKNLRYRSYVLLRFVSWDASHDLGLNGMTLEEKKKLVHSLAVFTGVLISSETPLPEELSTYAFPVHPAHMHDLLAGASLLVSESLTMAAEAAFLGTPSLCISPARAGTLDEEVRLGLIERFTSSQAICDRAIKLASTPTYKETFGMHAQDIVHNLTDVTALMIWFVEHYPSSLHRLRSDPSLENRFRPLAHVAQGLINKEIKESHQPILP